MPFLFLFLNKCAYFLKSEAVLTGCIFWCVICYMHLCFFRECCEPAYSILFLQSYTTIYICSIQYLHSIYSEVYILFYSILLEFWPMTSRFLVHKTQCYYWTGQGLIRPFCNIATLIIHHSKLYTNIFKFFMYNCPYGRMPANSKNV